MAFTMGGTALQVDVMESTISALQWAGMDALDSHFNGLIWRDHSSHHNWLLCRLHYSHYSGLL
jgi:hypothetical protein